MAPLNSDSTSRRNPTKSRSASSTAAQLGAAGSKHSSSPGRDKPGAARRPSASAPRQSASPDAASVGIGDRIVVTIKRIGINGEGVGYYKRKAAFIDGALPGEVVKATVTKAEPTFLQAELTEIEKRSPDRMAPPCPVYDRCGGCQLQHLAYPAQLRAKEELIREAFHRYTDTAPEALPLRPIAGMDDPWGYRNKAQLQVGNVDGHVLTGLYSPGTHKLVDISGCPVQHPAINTVVEQVKTLLHELHIPIYHERTRKGAVRTVVARAGTESGEVQLTFITAADHLPHQELLVRRIRETLPQVTTIAHNVNPSAAPLVFGDQTAVLWGKERLDETLGSVRFSLSPRAFFQLNPSQTVKLYDAVKEAAALTGDELVVDAYCGTGTIGLWLAPHAREVRGIEAVPEAIEDARDNARASGAANAQFYAGRAERLLPEWVQRGVRPDVVVVDPPRTGCERPLLDALAQAKPARLVYVSCNPSTLAKDCQVLFGHGYRLEWIQPVDMFPHTSHVECCSLLVRKD
ncbi:23S rRNA (uracil-C(5))-methyltransferase RlmCD [Paenibacillus solanacearum]|uniref:23S rRNA (Uracil-C(5))-methyltransferase RlmCD n=1 Tax=Paenibacillus solanacearum TaxID=2048548 RepID=A0A916K7J8_9BACL|nr:23S rRNA (uracil(1939)-C(5))-methyltransferase RlmD [Paenibacillus solanacearum]CAG7647897.1 23S rRNA (uracil-C(5))-methyltransferase RlmCD [Paenibacillus solanacearum]